MHIKEKIAITVIIISVFVMVIGAIIGFTSQDVQLIHYALIIFICGTVTLIIVIIAYLASL